MQINMDRIKLKTLTCLAVVFGLAHAISAQEYTDVLIVGGGAGGTSAAIQAARSGVGVTVIEPTSWLGGMLTSAGVAAIDGNHQMPSGIWGEFRDSLYQRYGGPKSVATGWVSHTLFEPAVGQDILRNLAKLPNIQIHFNSELFSISQENGDWHAEVSKGQEKINITAKIVIDATERGDLLELLNIPYRVGMDSQIETGESWAPESYSNIVQDVTYVALLEDVGTSKGRRGLVAKPKNYNPSDFECACKREEGAMFEAVLDCDQMLNYAKLPGDKYMLNWPNCGNDFYLDWPNLSKKQQQEALALAKSHTQGFIYYIQQELGYTNLRLSDEFPSKDGFALIPYDRESRRVKGKVFLTANHLENPFDYTFYRTGIAVGDYPIDHHHDKNSNTPEIDFISIRIPSYNIPLGALLPEQTSNFLVAEKNISVSNIANGTTRLQPVVLGIGQAAGALAALSIRHGILPDQVQVREVQEELLQHHAYLMPYIDVNRSDPDFAAMQRIGSCGILKGVGIPYKWANETWFYPEQLVSEYELKSGLVMWYPELADYAASGKTMSMEMFLSMLQIINTNITLERIEDIVKKHSNLDLKQPNQPLTRRAVSILTDELLHPFSIPIDHFGNSIKT
ncbi:MAG: hypothetical protein RLZZ241_2151 [Bacteroidota bacterium]|jgi:hypothetical protein